MTERQQIRKAIIGKKVRYVYCQGAISCEMNGRRICGEGTAKSLTKHDYMRIAVWVVDGGYGLCVRPSEITHYRGKNGRWYPYRAKREP